MDPGPSEADSPRVWKWARIAALAALAAALAAPLALAAAPSPAGRAVQRRALERGILVQINVVRTAHGLVPLHVSALLTDAAREHSRSMALGGYFSHDSADGSSFSQRVQRYYADPRFGSWSAGENLLWSSPDVDAAGAIELWMHSARHRQNLLAAGWREVGISAVHVAAAPGIFQGRPVTIVTADFGVRS
jgi:uncharacterized protein YkwD